MVALAAVVALALPVGYFIFKGKDSFQFAAPITIGTPPGLGNTEQIANSLFGEYLLPFEIASILLLVAVVGSVVMAKKRI